MTGSTPSIPPILPLPETDPAQQMPAHLFAAKNLPPQVAPTGANIKRPGQGRTEPHLNDDDLLSPLRGPTYEQPHRDQAPLYGQPGPQRSNLLFRALLMAAIFTVGIIVGLAAAWWMKMDFPGARVVMSINRNAMLTPGFERKPAGSLRGIIASELPYDGAPPPDVRPPATVMSSGAATPEAESVTVNPAPSKPAEKEDDEKASDHAKTSDAKVANPVPKRRLASKIVRNREIDRIRQQADDELKKKTTKRYGQSDIRAGARQPRKSRGRRPAAAPLKAQVTRNVPVRCERLPNFIRREQCKWQLCSGKWGTNGCPSYAASVNPY